MYIYLSIYIYATKTGSARPSKVPENDALVELNDGSLCNVLQGSIASPLQRELLATITSYPDLLAITFFHHFE
jgi:hypothetical protein